DESSSDDSDYPNISMAETSKGQSREKNSQLAHGYANHRSYVIRGSKIGVFKNDIDNIEYSATINNISTPSGKTFSPGKVMLHERDSKMILMNPDSPEKLYQLDLTAEKVVDEWVRRG